MKDAKARKAEPKVELEAVGVAPRESEARERKWRADDALRTLTEAERVKKDRALMADVEKALKAKMRDLESIKVEMAPQTIGKGGK